MADMTFKGSAIKSEGNLPEINSPAPDFKAVSTDLSEKTLADYKGKQVVLNIFPSLDTGVCAQSVRSFYEKTQGIDNVVVLNVSLDLPFAQKRFCAAEGIENTVSLSDFRHHSFAKAYGVTMNDGPLAGLFSRAVVVINPDGKVTYTEQVPEITEEPNYDAAIKALG